MHITATCSKAKHIYSIVVYVGLSHARSNYHSPSFSIFWKHTLHTWRSWGRFSRLHPTLKVPSTFGFCFDVIYVMLISAHNYSQNWLHQTSLKPTVWVGVTIHWTGLLDWTAGLAQNGVKCLFRPFQCRRGLFQCRREANRVYSA